MTELTSAKLKTAQERMSLALSSEDPQSFFNNFIMKFPFPDDIRNQRYMAKIAEILDKKHRDIFQGGVKNMSELFLNQTPDEFYKQIDDISTDLGYSSKDVVELTGNRDSRAKFYSDLAPGVFMKLLELGYNEEELTI